MPLRQYRAECSLAGVGEGGRGSGTHVNDLVCSTPGRVQLNLYAEEGRGVQGVLAGDVKGRGMGEGRGLEEDGGGRGEGKGTGEAKGLVRVSEAGRRGAVGN